MGGGRLQKEMRINDGSGCRGGGGGVRAVGCVVVEAEALVRVSMSAVKGGDTGKSKRGRRYGCLFEGQEQTQGQEQVCAEILSIMQTYHEQEASPRGVGTPGGLEHMGDVWSLFSKWERMLSK